MKKISDLFLTTVFSVTLGLSPALAAQSFIVPNGPTNSTQNQSTQSQTQQQTSNQQASNQTSTNQNQSGPPETFAKPKCSNSTCITSQTINNASNKHVDVSPVKTYVALLEPAGSSTCQATYTGVTTYRQVQRGVWEYNDAFCINQGCVYMGTPKGSLKCQ